MGESKDSMVPDIPSVFISGNMGQVLTALCTEEPTIVFLFQADSMDARFSYARLFRFSPMLLTLAGALLLALGLSCCCRFCASRRRNCRKQNNVSRGEVVTGVVVTGIPLTTDVTKGDTVVIAVPVTAS